MPMAAYPVICYSSGCSREAIYKIAARWSDGLTEELKTYALACSECLPALFRDAQGKRDRCRLAADETLEAPGIFQLDRGARDRGLQRCLELERDLGETEKSV
jgi:hypothetical protein